MRKYTMAIAMLFAYVNIALGLGDNRNFSYRTPIIPQTFCFAKKGDLKLFFSWQMYAPETKWHKAYPFWERVGITLGDLIISGGNNFTATYSPTKSWAFGAGCTHIDWMDFYTVGTDIFNVEYSTQYIGERQALKFSGFYHNRVAENLEYEVGTSLLFGNGKFEFPESLPNMYPPELSYLTYKMFTQNFVGSLSYRYKKLQLTAQLNTGYVRYYDIDYAPVLPGLPIHSYSLFESPNRLLHRPSAYS